ncbi:MAG: hypothetical protein HPY71_15430 [Firmicutes bacterium]|nr:hypothetical protein [Bacillota bacterium]
MEFRGLASRLLRTDFREGIDNLHRLLDFIARTPILRGFVEKCQRENPCVFDIETIISFRKYGDLYQVPTNREGEVAFVYALLSRGAEKFGDYYQLCAGYGFGTGIQEHVDSFNRMVVMPFVNHLLLQIEEESIILGCVDNLSRIHVGGNVGQVNVAEGYGSIIATNRYAETGAQHLTELAEKFLGIVSQSDVSRDNQEELRDLLESIVEQLKSCQQPPKKGILKVAIDKIREVVSLVGGVDQLTTVGKALYEELQQMLQHL